MASVLDDSLETLKAFDANIQEQHASVKSQVFAKLINGIHTDFAVIVYRNRMFVVVTQFGKIGNLYSVCRESMQKNGIISASSLFIFDINCVLGAESEEAVQAVRLLAEKLDISRPLLVSLTLPALDHPTVIQIAEAILEHKCW